MSLLLNGSLSPEISPSRGVKQGDPLSAFLFILAIEPLGNLLRQREEYGVSINDNVVLTNLLFADDTTLLSNSLSGVMEQLELVQIYCDGSGAKLNLSKSTMLVLNRTQNRPIFPHVKILFKTESVKYLGIPFSQSSVQELIMEILEKRFYDGFRMWFRRARTVRGRLLMAQTMILSRLWHYTTHFDVPQQLLRRWQSMLNKFVLSRKYEQNSTHVHLIRKEFLYMPRKQGGLQVPYMEAQLKKQRMLFLQQFISFSETTEIGHWKLPGNELLRSVSPAFGPFQSLDTLTISPKRNGDMVKWNIISSWWIQTITWFQESRWDVTSHSLPASEQLAHALHVPIWFHMDDQYHYEQTQRINSTRANRRCLGMVPEPGRSFRKQFAQLFRIRTLHDLFAGRDTWFPSCNEFILRFMVNGLQMGYDSSQCKLLRRLYIEVTQILRRIQPIGAILREPIPDASIPANIPYLGIIYGDKTCYFPHVPRFKMLPVVWKPIPPDKLHPMLYHLTERERDNVPNVVVQYCQRIKQLRRRLLPVYEDLQFRLALRILPVRSRFWFLKQANPDIILCTQSSCGEVESYQHLFFDCPETAMLWSELLPAWNTFFTETVKWRHVACATVPKIRPEWDEHNGVIADVWSALSAVALHFIWTDRNRRLFDKCASTPLSPAISVIYTTFSAHIRYFQRNCYVGLQREQLTTVLQRLLQSGAAQRFFSSRSDLLQIRWRR